MTVITRDDLRNQLKRREIAPVYVLFGAETYLRNLACKTIADFVLKGAQLREFNETQFSLSGPDQLQEALAAADQLPMMAERRVVMISDVRITSSGTRDSLKEDHEEALAKYLGNPSPSSVVIFIADEFDKRRKTAKLLAEKAVAVEFKQLEDEDALHWARGRIRELGFEHEEGAVRLLVSLAGDDLRRLANEIDKIATATLPDRLIVTDKVESLVGNSRELSNFELMDHLMARNRKKALEILQKLLNDGAEPLMLLGLIANNFRRLMLAKSMMEQGVGRSEVAKLLKLPYRKQEEFLASARRTDAGVIARMMERLAETDLAIKTSKGGGGPMGARLQIEVLICELVTN